MNEDDLNSRAFLKNAEKNYDNLVNTCKSDIYKTGNIGFFSKTNSDREKSTVNIDRIDLLEELSRIPSPYLG
jgi:hypothetical protein